MYIKYAEDYLSASMVSVQADDCEMCSSWPSELTAGRALPSDGAMGPKQLCFYDSSSRRNSKRYAFQVECNVRHNIHVRCAYEGESHGCERVVDLLISLLTAKAATRLTHAQIIMVPTTTTAHDDALSGKGLIVTSWSGWGFPILSYGRVRKDG